MSVLPNLHKATIDRRKVTDYLLARAHPTGRAKAAFFEGLGFSQDAPEVFEAALLIHASQNPVKETILTEFGTKFIVAGPLQTPTGFPARICVVWFAETGQSPPRLVTAFPD